MKGLFIVLTILCGLALTTVSFVQGAPTPPEGGPVVQVTLMEIDGDFFVVLDRSGQEQRLHVDKSTLIVGKIQLGGQVKAEVSDDGHASAVVIDAKRAA